MPKSLHIFNNKTIVFLIIFFFGMILHNSTFSQCSGGVDGGLISPSAEWQAMGVNTYTYYTFVAGYQSEVFIFSFCQAGGNPNVDTQLEVHYDDGSSTGFYNNDHCGLGSELIFVAPAAGIYRLSVYEFDCSTNSTVAGNLAYTKLPTPTTADCLGALPLCDLVNSHPVSAIGEGNYYDLYDFNVQDGTDINANICPNCLVTGERSSMWYTFTVSTNGLLGFSIIPNAADDYDWSLHNVTNNSCADLIDWYNNPPSSCNFAAGTGQTGMGPSGTGSCQTASGGQFNQRINVFEGETFVLHITNFSESTSGYTIDFGNSTASIVDNIPPTFDSLLYNPYCGSSSITVQLSEAIWCDGVDPSAFTISGPMGDYQIDDVWSALCTAGENTTYDGTFYDDVWTIELSDYLAQSGDYTLTLLPGGVEDICQNPSLERVLNFTIVGITADVDILSNAGCPGESNGSISVSNIDNGVPPYSVEWHGPNGFYSEDYTISNLEAGTYALRIIDDDGICEYLEEFVLDYAPEIELTIDGNTTYCEGEDVSVNVTSNIDPNASYSWAGPAGFSSADQNLFIPSATPTNGGQYLLTVTDDYGCTTGFQGEIEIIPQIPVEATSTGPYCEGDLIQLSVTEIAGASYHWTGPNGFEAFNREPEIPNAQQNHSGTYSVVVDYGNCSSSDNIDITVNPALSITLSSQDPNCYQEASGSITANIITGTPNYSYFWSNGLAQNPITNLHGNTEYCVTVIDNADCSTSECITLSMPPELVVEAETTETECGETDGQILATATGGTPNYQYVWSNGGVGQFVENLPPGQICVTVTDANSCTVEYCNQIPFFGEGDVNIELIQEISCFGDMNAVIAADMDNGALPLNFDWSSSNINSSTLSGLAAGEYSVTITDAYGCSGIDTIIVPQPDQLNLDIEKMDILCYGDQNGYIITNVTGGVYPYNYLWESGDTTTIRTDLSTGTYGLTVTDENLCTISEYIVIYQPARPLDFQLLVNDITCYNKFDGTATVIGNGGTPPYIIQWLQFGQVFEEGEEVNTLRAGNYQVKIKDDNNCFKFGNFAISEPPVIITDFEIDQVSCKDHDDGKISFSIEGGVPPYHYEWSTGDTVTTIKNLVTGNYYITIIDDNECVINETIFLPESNKLCLKIPDAFTPNGDGINDTWEIGFIEKYPEAVVNVFNRWGQHIYQGRPIYSDFWDGKFEGILVPTGPYIFTIDLRDGTEPFTGTVTVIY